MKDWENNCNIHLTAEVSLGDEDDVKLKSSI